MRILRFSHDYLVNTGGLMAHLRALNRALSGMPDMEVLQAFLIAPSQMDRLVESGRVRREEGEWMQADARVRLFPCTVPLRTPGRTDMDSEESCARLEAHLEDLIAQEKPDLLHVHLVRHRAQVVALRSARRAGLAVVLTHHEGRPETPEMAEILRQAVRLADRTCAVSSFAAAALGERPVDYQGFFVDQDFWNPQAVQPAAVESWRRRLALGPETRLLVYPARFIPRKNHALLLQGMRCLLDNRGFSQAGGPVHLALPGPTLPENRPYRTGLEQMAVDLGLQGQVTFLKVLAPEELRSLYAAAQMVVYPARNEGAGRSHLEGMLLGCCAAVANDGGLVEHVRHHLTGVTFSPESAEELASALLWVLVSEERRRRLAAAGRAAASRLTLEQYARDHACLYRELTEARTL